MPRKLHSFFVGIADYPRGAELTGCLVDINNMTDYIKNLETSFYDEILEPVILTDQKGNRNNILDSLEKAVAGVESEDTLLFYYTGHGVNEISKDLFKGNYNDMVQTLFCHNPSENNRLASKELRYLFNKCPKETHILAIFDCCHSGDMTRSIQSEIQIKTAQATAFPQRDFKDFVFSEKTTQSELKSKEFNDIFPDRNIVTLSACLSGETAYGLDNGGFFTNSLLKILKANHDIISYADLLKQIDLDIRRSDKFKQAPTISILGDRKYDQLTSWLRLNGDKLKSGKNFIQHNDKSGWIFSKGMLQGVNAGDEITIEVSKSSHVTLKVKKVNLVDSEIDQSSFSGLNLDTEAIYHVVSSNLIKRKPILAINNLDKPQDHFKEIESYLKNCEKISFSSDLNNADYHVNIFNGLMYFSFPYSSYQPLNKQIVLSGNDNSIIDLESVLAKNIQILINWFHYKNLEIQDSFSQIPLKVEIKTENSDYCDVTSGSYSMVPQGRHRGSLFKKYDLKVTNESNDNIYVTLLALYNSRHEISADGFEGETVEVLPGKSKVIENYMMFDSYQEIYNWESEKVYLKFLVNNYGEITQEIASLTQEGFLAPITHEGEARGGGSVEEIETPVKNAIYTTELILENNTINKISGELETNLELCLSNNILGPFIERLYPVLTKKKT